MSKQFYGLGAFNQPEPKEPTIETKEQFDLFGSQQEEKSPATFELAPGMTVEQVEAMFFNPDALKESPEQIFRLDRAGHRYYYVFGDNGEPQFFPSITTLIGQTTPTSPFLIKWIADMGYTRAEEYKNERAAYGTFMHGEYAKLLIAKEYDLDRLKDSLGMYMEANGLPLSFIDYADDLRKNMLSLAQFIIDTELEPLAVEIPLISRMGGFGCTLDLPCMITLKGERFPCIIDFKSGKHFYEDNEIQLHGCMMAWNENFEGVKMERVFNWRPKEWRTKPTYELKEQTNSPNAAKLPHLLEIAAIEDGKMDNTLTICNGLISLEKQSIDENYKSYSLSELVKKSKSEKTPEQGITKEEMTKETETSPEKQKRGKSGAKTEKGTNTPKKETKPKNVPKQPENKERNDLLNSEMDF